MSYDELVRLRAIEGRAVQAFETGGSADADQVWRDGYRAAADDILTHSHDGMRAELERLRAVEAAARYFVMFFDSTEAFTRLYNTLEGKPADPS